MVTANLPWVESPFFEEILKSKKLSAKEAEIAETYNRDGFVVLPGVLPESLIDAVLNDAKTKAFNPDFPLSTQRDKVRVQDFWLASEASRELACHPEILKTLELLYEREVVPFQTRNFSVGTQQRAHSDTIHF